MSQENVDALNRSIDAYNRRDIDALLRELDPEVVWESSTEPPHVGAKPAYRRSEGVREAMRDAYTAFAEIRIESSQIRHVRGRTVAVCRVHATRDPTSTIELAAPAAYVVVLKESKVVWVAASREPDAALPAAGQSG